MISKATLQKIASLLKIKAEDLETAQSDTAEKDVEIGELATYSADELTTLKNNEYNAGKRNGVEMAVKESKEKLGLDFQGKSIDGLIEAASKKALADAKIDPSQKDKELNDKITNLQNTVKEYEKKLSEKDIEVEGIKTSSELSGYIPAPVKDGVQYNQKEILSIMQANGYDFVRENGKLVVKKDGQLMQDKLSNPQQPADVIKGFMTERNYIKTEQELGGHGGSDKKPGSKAVKLSELKQQFASDGKSLLGEEFNTAVQAAVKEYPEFDMSA